MSNRLIAHLAHVEVLTPTPEQSLAFYRDVIGLEESGRSGASVYLRGWGEWSHHSVQLTEAAHPGLGHVGWRMWSPDDSSDPMPLLVVRDGPDYDRLAQLTPLLGRAVGAR